MSEDMFSRLEDLASLAAQKALASHRGACTLSVMDTRIMAWALNALVMGAAITDEEVRDQAVALCREMEFIKETKNDKS